MTAQGQDKCIQLLKVIHPCIEIYMCMVRKL